MLIRVNESIKYKNTKVIKKLYHSVFNEKSKNYVLANGIKADSDNMVYLSEKPMKNAVAVFLVTIPDKSKLHDWREFWQDEDGNDIDYDHEYDSSNPYYVYLLLYH